MRAIPFRFSILLASVCLSSLWLCSQPKAAKQDKAGDPQALLSAGRANEALALLQSRTTADKHDAQSFNLLSRVYYSLGNWDLAIKAGERAIALDAKNSSYHLWLGRTYGEKAENSNPFSAFSLARKARAQFEEAVEIDGNNIEARSDLTEYYTEAPSFLGGGKDKARAQIAAIAQKDPSVAHYLSARLAEKDKRFTDAEREYKAAIQESKMPAEHWVNLASYYRQRGNLAAMEDAIAKAVEAPRKQASVVVDAASVLFQAQRDLPKAAELLRQYLASPDKVEEAPAFRVEYSLGQILEKMGDKGAAAKEYDAALVLARDYEEARAALQRLRPSAA
jgi:tetratricopeptide (TPR) repeat protein